MASNSSAPDELRIVLIGKTGSGKSSTANTILGYKKFDEACSFDSQTCRMQCVEVTRFDKKLLVVDTPGLCDTQEDISNEDTVQEIKKAFIHLSPGPHAIILVIKGNQRYGKEDRDIANLFADLFGNEMLSHFFVIFCGRDELERNGSTLDKMLKACKQQELKRLIANCKGRYFGFDNKSKSSDENQVKHLIDEINNNVRLNGGNHYSNELFKDIEKTLEQKGITAEDLTTLMPETVSQVHSDLKPEELPKDRPVLTSEELSDLKLSKAFSALEPVVFTKWNTALSVVPVKPPEDLKIKILKVITAPIWGPFYLAGKLAQKLF